MDFLFFNKICQLINNYNNLRHLIEKEQRKKTNIKYYQAILIKLFVKVKL